MRKVHIISAEHSPEIGSKVMADCGMELVYEGIITQQNGPDACKICREIHGITTPYKAKPFSLIEQENKE